MQCLDYDLLVKSHSTSYSSDSFTESHYQNTTLYVPQKALKAYQNSVWVLFENLRGFDASGIDGLEIGEDGKANVYYDMRGRKSATPHHGVNIVRHPDGTTHKVIMK